MIAITAEMNAARLAAIVSFLDDGPGVAKLTLYANTRPLSPTAAPGVPPVVICELALPSGAVSASGLRLIQGEDALVLTTDAPVWARAVSRAGLPAMDMDVRLSTDPPEAGEVVLPAKPDEAGGGRVLYAGGVFRIAGGFLR